MGGGAGGAYHSELARALLEHRLARALRGVEVFGIARIGHLVRGDELCRRRVVAVDDSPLVGALNIGPCGEFRERLLECLRVLRRVHPQLVAACLDHVTQRTLLHPISHEGLVATAAVDLLVVFAVVRQRGAIVLERVRHGARGTASFLIQEPLRQRSQQQQRSAVTSTSRFSRFCTTRTMRGVAS